MKIQTQKVAFSSQEYDEVLKIRMEVFVHEQQIPRDLEVHEFEQDCIYFLTTVDGVPAATGRLSVKGPHIKFERVATLKMFRGKGAASDLMVTMQKYARTHFPKLVPYMHSQESAVSFYEKLGWQKSGGPFVEADIPHQCMILK